MSILADSEGLGARLYRALSSTRLTIFLLIILVFAMVVGTVLPQEGDDQAYIEAFGSARYVSFYSLGLLDIFHSWWFLLLSFLLFINLALCSIRGLQVEIRLRSRAAVEAGEPSLREIQLPAERRADLSELLKRRRYRVRCVDRGESQMFICQKGLPARPWSIIYHAALAVAFLGFVFSALSSFDGEVYLKAGEERRIPLASESMGIHKLFGGRLSSFEADRTDSLVIRLERFDTEYTWYNDRYFPKDWKSTLLARAEGRKEAVKEIEVNHPMRYAGLTIYQWDYRQWLDLALPETVMTVLATENFQVPGLEGNFRTGTIYVGTLFKQGEAEPIVPNTVLYKVTSGGGREKIGELSLGIPFTYEGVEMEPKEVREASGLYYRRDDGVRLLYPAFLAFMFGLFLRVFWPSYRLSILCQPKENQVRIWGKASGVAAYLEKEIGEVESSISSSGN